MRTRITLRSLLRILLTLAVLPLWALDKGGSASHFGAAIVNNADSLLPVRNSYYGKEELIARFRHEDIASRNDEVASRNEELVSDLLSAEADYNTTGNNRRVLVRLLKILRVKKNRWDARSGARLFN